MRTDRALKSSMQELDLDALAEEADAWDALTPAELDAVMREGEVVDLHPRPLATSVLWDNGKFQLFPHGGPLPGFAIYYDTGWSEPAPWSTQPASHRRTPRVQKSSPSSPPRG